MKQSDLESEMRDMGIKRYRDKVLRTSKYELESTHPVGKRLLEASVLKLAQGIESWKRRVNRVKAGSRHSALPYIESLPSDLVAALTARTVIDAISIQKRLVATAMDVARTLEDEIKWRRLAEANPSVWRHTVQFMKHQGARESKRRQARRAAQIVHLEFESWPLADKTKVGMVLVELMRQHTGMIDIVTRSTIFGKRMTFVRATDETLAWIKEAHAHAEDLTPVFMPMIQPPAPWKDLWFGGYLTDAVAQRPLVKTRDQSHLRDLDSLDLTRVLNAINHIQSVKWSINESVADVFTHCYRNDVAVAGLPTLNGNTPPPKPDDIDTNAVSRRQWKKAAAKVYSQNEANRSRRIQVGRIAWLADKFRGQSLYFPWYMDYRSRHYPRPYYLQPQGADYARGLLRFGEGCHMDNPEAQRWAAIHGANCYGMDKGSFDERIQWVDDNKDMITAVGRDPLNNIDAWASADEPWAFLAFCLDYAQFLELGGEHVWTSPVTIDGSSNGLQLFSLIMRDPVGAKWTNVLPSDRPHDIYQRVSDIACMRLSDQAKEGCEISSKWLLFGVDRKCAKRPCMVVPYSGTLFAVKSYTRDWFHDELRARHESSPFGGEDDYKPCGVLAEALWWSIDQVVGEAKKAMEWLRQISDICVANEIPIRWTTPVGFLCKQAYESYDKKTIKTIVGDKIRAHQLRVGDGKMSRAKNRNGLVPNWIHSFDASLSLDTANRCRDHGITSLGPTHDAFSTLPAFMGTLQRLLLDSVVDLFGGNPMEDLVNELRTYLPSSVDLPDPPERGSLDIETVRNSQYFFS